MFFLSYSTIKNGSVLLAFELFDGLIHVLILQSNFCLKQVLFPKSLKDNLNLFT